MRLSLRLLDDLRELDGLDGLAYLSNQVNNCPEDRFYQIVELLKIQNGHRVATVFVYSKTHSKRFQNRSKGVEKVKKRKMLGNLQKNKIFVSFVI